MRYIFQIFLIIILFYSIHFSEILESTKSIPKIQELIDKSKNGDTVLVPPGIYYENINFKGKKIVVMSYFLEMKDSSYIQSTIISGMLQGCVVTFENGEDSTAELNGFTIREGISYSDTLHGGGITIRNNSSATLKNLIVTRNAVEDCNGAGILCRDNSKVIFENLIITENESKNGNGGGIFIINSNAKISDAIISNNKSNSGGGILSYNSKLKIINTKIFNNISENGIGGSGLLLDNNSNITILNCEITKNNILWNSDAAIAPSGNGGGIFIKNNSFLKIDSSKISNNISKIDGGGISLDSSQIEINNSIIENNISQNNGGGFFINPGNEQIKFSNIVVKNNSAENIGGGIYSNFAIELNDNMNNSIFLNKANLGSTDIHFEIINSKFPNIISLDTVTVSEPEKYHINIIDKISFNFKHSIFNSVNSDLYVSPNGSDSNNGILPISPLRTISFANLVAKTDSVNQRIINLLQGVYSSSTNDETFPIYLRDNISLVGNKVDQTILDGENKNSLIKINPKNKNVNVEKLTIQNGYDLNGSGISVSGKNILLKDLLIKNNTSENDGAGLAISLAENVKLTNLTVAENISKNQTSSAGILINGEKVSVINCIIYNNKPKNIKLRKGFLPNSELTISNSNLVGGRNNIDNLDSIRINWLFGNTDSDPMFIGGEPFDYSLTENSPCVNSGTSFLVWEGDTLINLSADEYIGFAPDMGAIESDFLISINEDENLPTEYSLSQNYPNPFNPSTKIKYSIPSQVKSEKSNVELVIFDILGKEVKTLINQYHNPGNYEVTFEAQNLPSGIYFYQLKTDNFSETKKLILLK
ncbi:MAG: right-handed parallel beta-helix repeat-containing protein [Ignavibacteriae bacterium]|nr:right-handed parallel beta-helix repeat-containing protein [Ignavibacteriota bacterium]